MKPMQNTAPERVTVTLPPETKSLFAWLKNYDSRFDGKDATLGAYLIKKGIEAVYEEGLENVEPLDSDVIASLTTHAHSSVTQALEEDDSLFLPSSPRKASQGRKK